jgi:L-aminopeptidase/D-esterase-like protein
MRATMATSSANFTLTSIPGMRVGHVTDRKGATGCTVILCPPGTVGGVDVRGGAPGTRETDLLRPMHRVEHVNAVVLSGGSAFGLATADGVMRYLEANEIGYKTRTGHLVPIVPAAIVFDLGIGEGDVKPSADDGYAACEAATMDPVEQGSVGAGTGCRVGAAFGNAFSTKGGIGCAMMELDDGLRVAALVVVNAVGDVVDEHGQILAGVRTPPEGAQFAGMLNVLRHLPPNTPAADARENTVIGVIATNARLSKEHTNIVARMAHDGIARAVVPAHTAYDGDTLFALATGTHPADSTVIGAFAAEVVAQAVRNAVLFATSLHDVKARRDWLAS